MLCLKILFFLYMVNFTKADVAIQPQHSETMSESTHNSDNYQVRPEPSITDSTTENNALQPYPEPSPGDYRIGDRYVNPGTDTGDSRYPMPETNFGYAGSYVSPLEKGNRGHNKRPNSSKNKQGNRNTNGPFRNRPSENSNGWRVVDGNNQNSVGGNRYNKKYGKKAPISPLQVTDKETGEVIDRNQSAADNIIGENEKKNLVSSMFEGDIVKTPRLTKRLESMARLSQDGFLVFDAANGMTWPNGVVPYTFGLAFRGQKYVKAAIEDIQKFTCINFRLATTADRNYIQFVAGVGCSSMIGYQGGRQRISLASIGCMSKGIALHEIMHALGFFHEQSRLDRDKFIKINFGNVKQNMIYNFKKYKKGHASTLGEPYDLNSVMHYGNYAFAVNRRIKTIEARGDPNKVLGQRNSMSTIDIKQLNKYYNCEKKTLDLDKPAPLITNKKGKKVLGDKYLFCSDIKSWCLKDSFVYASCRHTCCLDRDRRCPKWSNAGHCMNQKVNVKRFMRKYCKLSCGIC